MAIREDTDRAPHFTLFDLDSETGGIRYAISGYGREVRGQAPAGTTSLSLLLGFLSLYAPEDLRELPSGFGQLSRSGDLLESQNKELVRAFAGAQIAAFSLDVQAGQLQMLGGHQYFNQPEANGAFGISLSQVLETLDRHQRHVVEKAISSAINTRDLVTFNFQAVGRERTAQAYEVTCIGEFNAQDDCQTILGTLQNVTVRHATELALVESESKLRAVIDHTRDAITIKDPNGRLLLVNPQAARALGASAEQLIGHGPVIGPLDDATLRRIRAVDEQVLQSGETVTYELDWLTTEGTATASVTEFPFWLHGEIQGTVCISHDITQQKRLELQLRESAMLLEQRVQERTHELERFTAQLEHTTLHDELTGLPNRALLMNRLEAAVAHGHDDADAKFVVLFLDFDRFKLINDSLGHAAGDDLLIQIAGRLREAVGASDTVARLGGDEFVVLARGIQSQLAAQQYAAKLTDQFIRPFLIGAHELRITASIGSTPCDFRYASASDAVRDADIAMYRAKAQSRGSHVVFEPEMRERQVMLLGIQSELGQALRRGELKVHYQPVVTGQGDRVSGVEALVRWQHPVHGLIPPADFIGLAEERGLICELDLWVLRQACSEMMQLSGSPLGLGVNFSARHFEHPGLFDQVRKILNDTGYPAHRLILEITERLLMTDDVLVLSLLKQLQDGGIQVAIDDFGTGYSSLRYIQQLPLNIIKIDRCFCAGVMERPEIVRSIVELAHTLRLTVVAEGVETVGQLQALTALGCDYLQGFLFSKPLPFNELRQWLKAFGTVSRDWTEGQRQSQNGPSEVSVTPDATGLLGRRER